MVAVVFHPFHVVQALLGIIGRQGKGGGQGFPGALRHVDDGEAALLHGQGRMGQEAFFQAHAGIASLGFLFPDHQADQRFQSVGEGQEQNHHRQAQDGIDQRQGEGVHHRLQEREANDGVGEIEQRRAHHHADDRGHQIDIRRPFPVGFRA